MNEILSELNKGNSVIIEREKLDEFLDFSKVQKDYYSEDLVKIAIVGKHTIQKL